ncbi:utrophin-like [Neosynchiropus ocellatus]
MDDEHTLILQYCQTLGGEGSPYSQPQSPAQILQAVEREERGELERIIARLEEEQRALQREYEQLKEQHGQRGAPAGGPWELESSGAHVDESDLLAEAKLLRQHKGRLEGRMHILEEHNKQLESQLHRLRQLLHQPEVDLRVNGVSSPAAQDRGPLTENSGESPPPERLAHCDSVLQPLSATTGDVRTDGARKLVKMSDPTAPTKLLSPLKPNDAQDQTT